MNNNPSIIVLSCSTIDTKSIINTLAKCAQITQLENDDCYSWNVDTKYYTAVVHLYPINSNTNIEEIENIEAIVIHFDSNRITGLDDLTKWLEFTEKIQPEIRILVADQLDTNTKITKRCAIGWCLKNGFELIELNPLVTTTQQNNDEDLIKEKTGPERVIEALETHMWSNLVMKSKVNEEVNTSEQAAIDPTVSSNIDHMLDSLTLDDCGHMEFGDLFQQLHNVKESIQSMSVRERRHCADQVVAAFWRAIGGDDDEI